ncbi:serine/threonine-protein kinase [Streptomyces sp. SID3343]|uniref:protein kinase domain-containing protein n=1 Tax=Streptomyces sp. SID3343 TaxID=2690260 RepID=UPI00136D4BE2|nr:protein kinase [Streptomyces sp. SID3343]
MRTLGDDDPRELGGYRLLRVLGSGGMGRVYLGRGPRGRFVAVKVIRAELAEDAEFRLRFRREVEAGRRVDGRWTGRVLDADPDAPRPWLVTRFVAGPSLHEAVGAHGPLPEEAVRALGAGLAAALVTVHDAGLVHRDLKPSNVLLTLDGPCVIDFGISRALDATALTTTGVSVGSPAYMSPEQANGHDVGPASDVFALGSVLGYAASGIGPFGEGNDQAHMFRIIGHEPDLSRVPYSMQLVVEACLHKDPAQRPTPAQIVTALTPYGDPGTLFTSGWLPAPVVEGMARGAVELLEIEADPEPAADLAPTRVAGMEATRLATSAPTSSDPEPSAPAEPAGRRRGLWKYPLVLLVGAAVAAGSLFATVGFGRDEKPKKKALPAAELPVEYARVWQGQRVGGAWSSDPGVRIETIKVALNRGVIGDRVGRISYLNTYFQVRCETVVSLKTVDKPRIVLGAGTRPEDRSFCAQSDATLDIVADGTLEFTMTAPDHETYATTLRPV